eukprot:m.8862 g.8862  ORF g.8862 m.8862 type:complete len:53 (+) comp4111_c0_seq2:159-317(+)
MPEATPLASRLGLLNIGYDRGHNLVGDCLVGTAHEIVIAVHLEVPISSSAEL